jgi:hypothetical protein
MIQYSDLPEVYDEDVGSTLEDVVIFDVESKEDVEVCSDALKRFKNLSKDTKNKKKEALVDVETERKEVSKQLDVLKEQKKVISEPFDIVSKVADDYESQIRVKLNIYSNKLEQERLNKEAEMRALEQARKNAADQAEKDRIEKEIKDNLQNDKPIDLPSNVITRSKTAYRILDFDIVPDKYLIWTIDLEALNNKLEEVFPGININVISAQVTDLIKADPEFVQATPDTLEEDLILEDLRKGVDIPGIEKYDEKSVVVR